MIEDAEGLRLWGGCRYIGTATNNVAEYLALIDGLKKVAEWKPERVEAYLDSKLVVEQMEGRYRVKHPDLQVLHRKATQLAGAIGSVQFRHVERARNKGADALANRAIDEYKP